MLSSRAPIFVLVFLLGGLCAAPAGTQEPWSPLVPRGHLRLTLLGEYRSFGKVHELPGLELRPAPLADRFSGAVNRRILPLLSPVERVVREAVGDPDLELSLGEMTAVVERSDLVVPLALDAGVLDWLTVGVVVPLVQNETEFGATFAAAGAAANAGFSPGVDDPAIVTGFLGGLESAIGAYDGFRSGRCALDPNSQGCRDATARLADARDFQRHLAAMYGGFFVPLQGSAAATALEERMQELATALQMAGIPLSPGTLPLAGAPITADELAMLIGDPRFGVQATHGLESWRSLWRLGDVAVRAQARLIEGGNPAGNRQWAAGVGALARLPTGTQDDPGNPLDAGSGDRQPDIEVRGWVHGRGPGSLGIWAEALYGLQMTGSTVRRVFDPAATFAPRATETTLDWTPGNYLAVELAPWYRLAEPLAIVGGYRFLSKGEDTFSISMSGQAEATEGGGGATTASRTRQESDPSILVPGSAASLSELLFGMIYRQGGAAAHGEEGGRPLEIRVIYRRALGGSGATPAGGSLEVGFRFHAQLW